jgi:hypothetical protein
VGAFEKVQNAVKRLLGSTRRQRITRHDRAGPVDEYVIRLV